MLRTCLRPPIGSVEKELREAALAGRNSPAGVQSVQCDLVSTRGSSGRGAMPMGRADAVSLTLKCLRFAEQGQGASGL